MVTQIDRIYGANSYTSALAADLAPGATTMQVDSASGLPTLTPGQAIYLTINPGNANREYVRVTSISGTTLTVVRGLAGSQGTNHTTGSIVLSDATQQWLDDIYAAFNSVLGDISSHIAATADPHSAAGYLDSNHEGAADPHSAAGYLTQAAADARYLQLTGGTLTGGLTINGILAMLDNINMTNNRVRNMAAPVVGTDALSQDAADARYEQISAAEAKYLQLNAENVMGASGRIRGLDLPTVDGEAASKLYHDENTSGPALNSKWTFDGVGTGNPGSGKLQWNPASPSTTNVFIHSNDDNGVDKAYLIELLSSSDVLLVVENDDSSRWDRFVVTSRSLQAGNYWDVVVLHAATGSGGSPRSGRDCTVYFLYD